MEEDEGIRRCWEKDGRWNAVGGRADAAWLLGEGERLWALGSMMWDGIRKTCRGRGNRVPSISLFSKEQRLLLYSAEALWASASA